MDLLKIVTPRPHLIVNTDDVHTTYYACRLRVYASSVNDPLVYHTRPRRNKNKKKIHKRAFKNGNNNKPDKIDFSSIRVCTIYQCSSYVTVLLNV